jgi:hypothetical protein
MLIEPDAHHLAGSVKVDVLHIAVPHGASPALFFRLAGRLMSRVAASPLRKL